MNVIVNYAIRQGEKNITIGKVAFLLKEIKRCLVLNIADGLEKFSKGMIIHANVVVDVAAF